MQINNTLLTIAIPTYNRADLLSVCLNSITSQIDSNIAERIEVIVFDNNSIDHTTSVVDTYINNGFAIKYYKNEVNIGADKNIASCFIKANGVYV